MASRSRPPRPPRRPVAPTGNHPCSTVSIRTTHSRHGCSCPLVLVSRFRLPPRLTADAGQLGGIHDVDLRAERGSVRLGRSRRVDRAGTVAQCLAAAITLAGGSTIGGVPPQRRWFLGSTHTIRGQSSDTAQSGTAFWMTRTELGRDFRAYRVSGFCDLGWVGDRTKISDLGRPLSGAARGSRCSTEWSVSTWHTGCIRASSSASMPRSGRAVRSRRAGKESS